MIQDILSGTYDDDLDSIVDAVAMRRKRVARQITVGSRVRITRIRPKYMEGATGTIIKRNQKTFEFRADDDVDTGRFGSQFRVPMTSVEAI